MKITLTSSLALLASTGLAMAGGLDRSGLGISPLFEAGSYSEFSLGFAAPDVTGTDPLTNSSGDMAGDYMSFGAAIKQDVNDKLSFALLFEQAYGASVDYTNTDPGYLLTAALSSGFTAELGGSAISALARYKINDRFSVHGGLRAVTMSGDIDFTAGTSLNYGASTGVGYAIGAAYEIPDIALRASLTYNSATTHDNAITATNPSALGPAAAATGSYDMPQSVNLDFRTGIAADTLLIASVRWADWTSTAINTQSALGTIDYSNDVMTYGLGVARRFNDSFAGVLSLSFEEAQGGTSTNLAPTDGKTGITLAGIYTKDNMTLTAGINYTMLGDTTTETISADFSGNSAIGFGVKVGYSY